MLPTLDLSSFQLCLEQTSNVTLSEKELDYFCNCKSEIGNRNLKQTDPVAERRRPKGKSLFKRIQGRVDSLGLDVNHYLIQWSFALWPPPLGRRVSLLKVPNACNVVDGHCLQVMKIVHHYTNGCFDWLISEQRRVNPSREAISVLSGKHKWFTFVHSVGDEVGIYTFLSTWSGDSVNINCFAKYLNFSKIWAKTDFTKFKYFEKVLTYLKYPDHVLQKLYMICSYFKSLKFFRTAIEESFRENFS